LHKSHKLREFNDIVVIPIHFLDEHFALSFGVRFSREALEPQLQIPGADDPIFVIVEFLENRNAVAQAPEGA